MKGDAAVTSIAVTDAAVVLSAPAVSLFAPPALNATVETPLIHVGWVKTGDREWTSVETTTLTGTLFPHGRTLETVRAENIKASKSVYTESHREKSRDTAILDAKVLSLTGEGSAQDVSINGPVLNDC
jgi:hypothetical protein